MHRRHLVLAYTEIWQAWWLLQPCSFEVAFKYALTCPVHDAASQYIDADIVFLEGEHFVLYPFDLFVFFTRNTQPEVFL